VNCGGEWRVESNAAIAVSAVGEAHRREDERERRRGQHVVHREPGRGASPERARPVRDLAALHPRHRLPRRVIDRGESDRLQQTRLKLLGDAGDLLDLALRLASPVRFGPLKTRSIEACLGTAPSFK
jgi:hypothetical protein